MAESLYARLGGLENTTQIVNDGVDNHASKARIKTRFSNSDLAAVKKAAAEFIITGTGGSEDHTGKGIVAVDAGMNVDKAEFVEAVSDVMDAHDKNGIGQREIEEVLFVFFSMKENILFG